MGADSSAADLSRKLKGNGAMHSRPAPGTLPPPPSGAARPAKRTRLLPTPRAAAAAADCSTTSPHYDVAVAGGGAAGLAAAYFAAAAGARVVVLEKEREPGRKILISGGARCNVLPAACDVDADFETEDRGRSALRALFSRWSLAECRSWLEDADQVGIPLKLEAATNKLFPASDSARDVRDALVAACEARGVRFARGAPVAGLAPAPGGGWRVLLGGGAPGVAAARVVLCTGGKSFPTLGTTGDGYAILEGLSHEIRRPYPALTPLLAQHPGSVACALPGVAVYDARLRVERGGSGGGKGGKGKAARRVALAERTALLLTHRGWSGPAILDLSGPVVRALERGLPPPALRVQWLADNGDAPAWEARLGGAAAGGGGAAAAALRAAGLPARLADALCAEAGLPPGRRVAELRKAERVALVAALTGYEVAVRGHEGYAKAEVTGGGLPLGELDVSTMASRRAPGLHVAGELLDVHGRIGGFNFWAAWTTGRLAGLGAAAGARA
jgi:predicted Rossmann fold flavoprotein